MILNDIDIDQQSKGVILTDINIDQKFQFRPCLQLIFLLPDLRMSPK